eukprot:jgi/Bigna1/70101/fgenesh1_pg.10_\
MAALLIVHDGRGVLHCSLSRLNVKACLCDSDPRSAWRLVFLLVPEAAVTKTISFPFASRQRAIQWINSLGQSLVDEGQAQFILPISSTSDRDQWRKLSTACCGAAPASKTKRAVSIGMRPRSLVDIKQWSSRSLLVSTSCTVEAAGDELSCWHQIDAAQSFDVHTCCRSMTFIGPSLRMK